jgi:hypothetical protein
MVAEALVPIFIVLGFLAAFVLSYFYYIRAKHTEKMVMIEKGYQPPVKQPKVRKKKSNLSLKWGIVIISLAIGLFMGFLVATSTTVHPVISYFSLIMLFGGTGLVLNHYLELKIKDQEI